ncbi:hypothetical protein BDV36DRAFT_263321 [Aspergillus pseudocaelatus]|uniref:Uncharacterized protein n=1 Tax=Aspergillus pseudocaelatus TaxID=1825620 RepID=A0ABQ6WDK7_9EURO|nr:hypothetical protein BDV36DRAFT_263321 [Aspergillus pseudocaelatus]
MLTLINTTFEACGSTHPGHSHTCHRESPTPRCRSAGLATLFSKSFVNLDCINSGLEKK